MKKMMIALVALFGLVASARGMSYEQARQQALFLTDKMAYELNLTEEQYEAAYEVNLDYLMGVNTQADLYGTYWERRNLDLSYILLDWQYRRYLDATYFYRPLYWSAGYWHFGIYARYPHRDYFFFGRPHFFNVYRGGHAWHMNGGRSWYEGRRFVPKGHSGSQKNHFGMHDRFQRGDFGKGQRGPSGPGNNGRGFSGGNTKPGQNPGTKPNAGNVHGGAKSGVAMPRGESARPSGSNGRFGGSRMSSTRTTTGNQPETKPSAGQTSMPRNTFTPKRTEKTSPTRIGTNAPSRQSSPTVGNREQSRPSMNSGSSRSTSSRSSSPSMGGSRSGGSHSGGGGSRGGFGGRR